MNVTSTIKLLIKSSCTRLFRNAGGAGFESAVCWRVCEFYSGFDRRLRGFEHGETFVEMSPQLAEKENDSNRILQPVELLP